MKFKLNSFYLSIIQMRMAALVLSLGYAAAVAITAWIFKPETALGKLAVWLTWTPAYLSTTYWVLEAIRVFWKHILEEECKEYKEKKNEGSE